MQGGAYGCSLGFSQISGIATYSSYRDPNIASTLAAYDATGDHLRRHPPSAAELSKAIIGAIGIIGAMPEPTQTRFSRLTQTRQPWYLRFPSR